MDDPYSILNLYPDCTYEEAKAAYRKAALMHHPDRHPPARKAEAERRFRILADAFQQVCHELGHPIEPPELMPPQPSTGSTRAGSIKAGSQSTALARSAPRAGSDKPRSGGPVQRRPAEQELKRNQELDELEEQVPYEDDKPYLDQPVRAPSTRSGPPRARPADERYEPEEYGGGYRGHQQPPVLGRRPSFSQPSAVRSMNRPSMIEQDQPLAAHAQRRGAYPDRQDLYTLKPTRRDEGGFGYGRGGGADDWDFGLGSDDFFGGGGGGGGDRFGTTNTMMSNIGMGFDNMMSAAFKGLSMAGPDPSELARMDNGGSCAMRMRQSKMVMGRTEDGSWAGKRMEKQMKMANGRLEVNENAQDIRVGSGGGGRGPPPRKGPGRSHAEDWDPPPAYQGDEEEPERETDYGRNVDGYPHPQGRTGVHSGDTYAPGPGGMLAPRMPMNGGGSISGQIARRRGSVSQMNGSVVGGSVAGGYCEQDYLQKRPEPRYEYGPESNRPSRSMSIGSRGQIMGPASNNRAIARRSEGEVAARY